MISAETYSERFTTAPQALLQKVLDDTIRNHPHAHMISGHVQGQFLSTVSKLMRPKRILEIGTFTGFSALCLAEGLADDGILYTVELRDADADTAQQYFNQSAHAQKIKLLRGNALDIIPALTDTWDLIFLDADKTGYTQYYEQVIPHLRSGGLLLADNVLFHGEVLQETIKGKNAIAIDAFNHHVKNDNRVSQVLLTLRDGLMMIQKN